jgi:hypothetical protein
MSVGMITGCGRHALRSPDEAGKAPNILTSPKVEVVWVDPVVVTSDQQMTLIRSDRVDSIELAAGEIAMPPAPAICFEIADRPCLTSVSMLDSRGKLLQPLLMKTLEPGHYKLTVHKPPPGANPAVPYNYTLRAIFCGQTTTVRISPGWTGSR